MKIKSRYNETVVNNFIDAMTGELIQTESKIKSHKIVVHDKDQFSFIYGSIIGGMKNLNGVEVKVLIYCSTNCAYNSNLISLTKPFISIMSKDLNVAEGSIKNAIKILVREKVLISLGSGAYRVNPKYFWRGENVERTKMMRYILEVECEDC